MDDGGGGREDEERTDGDFTDWAFGSVFLLVGAFGLAHAFLVDVGVFGVGAALLWCLGLEEGGCK